MKTLRLLQGSSEWAEFRLSCLTASEAPAMMGVSKYQSRDDLIKTKATGISPEISEYQRAIFNRGHESEASIRSHAETIIGSELYPITGLLEVDGLRLLASFDGLTADDRIGFEHKLYAAELADCVANTPENLHMHYVWQMEQQLLVSGAEYILFVVSDGTPEKCVSMKYYPVAGRREQLIAGWKQFKIDVANYVAKEPAPEAVAEEVEMLPSIDIRANGQISVIDNLNAFEQRLSVFLSDKLIREPKTDNDFATLDLQIKAMVDAENKLKMAGQSILAQIQAVDDAMRRKDSLQELVRQNRLMAEKLLTSEKERRKREIIDEAKQAFIDHITTCNQALANTGTSVRMPDVPVDFVAATKGKRTIDSLRSACNDELARGKIEANRILSKMDDNLALLRKIAVNHKSLFADIQQLVLKDKDALEAIAKQRIAEHEAAEKARIEAEAQRIAAEKIAEEEAKRAAEQAGAIAEKTKEVGVRTAEVAPAATQQAPIESQVEMAPMMASVKSEPPAPYGDIPARRPPDHRLIEVLSSYFEVEPSLAIEWLRTMNLDAVEKRFAA